MVSKPDWQTPYQILCIYCDKPVMEAETKRQVHGKLAHHDCFLLSIQAWLEDRAPGPIGLNLSRVLSSTASHYLFIVKLLKLFSFLGMVIRDRVVEEEQR